MDAVGVVLVILAEIPLLEPPVEVSMETSFMAWCLMAVRSYCSPLNPDVPPVPQTSILNKINSKQLEKQGKTQY